MSLPTDAELNAIGVLRRRLIEARVIAPLLDAMSAEFGAERVRTIARDVIVRLAQEQGAQLADSVGGCSLAHFAGTLERWTADDALRIDVLEQSGERFDFNVTRCRYAEMYRELGIPELGAVLSCNRDAALIEGFNGEVEFSRTQTIMGGASHCDFRYTLRRAGP
ncbi:L-2-amino-thiazoline-4-carboxylic acid hydrolase [Gemmatimonas sp.]|jgi:hypothetical protein|uniref:L-2-amino-thiazoline-4-carboxylic acid hydrolase n=1 Tax=Gemmatimonas sp. TaxID=1962908 RepID=UPI0037C1B094